jgi:hypothetical protein
MESTMQRFSSFDIKELKLVYRILHHNLMNHTELMDAEFLESLQSWLQYRAVQDGVDLTDHSQWSGWLNGQAIASGQQAAQPRVIPLSLATDGD